MTTYLLTNQQKGGDNVELLNLIPYGKENAISREDLSKLTGWDDRKVREEIKRLTDFIFQQCQGLLEKR